MDRRNPTPKPTSSGPHAEGTADQDVLDRLIDERREFLELSDHDVETVRNMAETFRSFLDEFIEEFYQHLFSNPTTSSYLTDPETVERLKRKQRLYFESMLEARLDATYVRDRLRIGQAHADVGLEPRWFLGAYNQYLQFCFRRYALRCEGDLERYAGGTLSLLKIMLLDMGLGLDSYFAQATDELRKALRLLSQSNAELKEFARLASHDLKTPLATVAGYCDEFLDEFGREVPAEGRRLIETARAKALQLGHTVDELLSVSEASAQLDRRHLVPARRLFEGALERLHSEIESRRARVILPDEMPEVFAHPGRLQEVFHNLISNALKYTDTGRGTVKVSVATEKDMHVFRVSDNGPGIAEADFAKIFAPFRRLPQHRDQPGSGLGLYFAKLIIEEQEGRIWVTSTLGEGSTFFVALPIVDPGPASAESAG
ncbi:MAG: protoglobin domain-containing protein [Isosphaeraceae bacterium]